MAQNSKELSKSSIITITIKNMNTIKYYFNLLFNDKQNGINNKNKNPGLPAYKKHGNLRKS